MKYIQYFKHFSSTQSSNQNNNPKSARNSNASNKTFLNFGMVKLLYTPTNVFPRTFRSRGQIVNGGAPYSAIGFTELCLLPSAIRLPKSKSFDPIPSQLSQFNYWQYGIRDHTSCKRVVLGSVQFQCRSDLETPIVIRQLVIKGSSQWILGRNVTRTCNHLHINDNRLQFPMEIYGTVDDLSMVDSDAHNYVLLDRFINISSI